MKRILCFSAFLLLLAGCRSKSSDPVGNAVVIEIPETEKTSILDIVDDYRYITLKSEDHADAMLGVITKLRVYREKIYVMDNIFTDKLLIFDS